MEIYIDMENTSGFTKNNDYWILTIFYGIYRSASLFESVSNLWNHGVLKSLDGLLRFVFCFVFLFYTELLNATVNIKKNKIKMLSKFKKYPWKLLINSNKEKDIVGSQHIFGQCYYFIPAENTRKPKVFWCFQGV